MAKYELKFFDCYYNGDWCKVNYREIDNDAICITISDGDKEAQILLDKSTAIKFAKAVRTEISKIK
jgi:hypothetical protein